MLRKLLVVLPLLSMAQLRAEPATNPAPNAQKPAIVVFAAASLTDVLQKIGADFTRDRGQQVKFSFGSSATLARQLEAGAAADIYVSADEEWMDYVAQRGLIARDSRRDVLGNRLVLISPAAQPVRLRIARDFKLREALGATGRLAVGDPASVPAGKYAKAALTSLNVWDSVAPRLAPADNVRMALLYVSRGEAPLGIVYATDAKADAGVRVVDTFPENSHAPIRYPLALTAAARAGAAEFAAYLQSPAAAAQFAAAGFSVIAADARRAAAATAHNSRHPGANYSGRAAFDVPKAGRYRITTDAPIWIDVLAGGAELKATAFHGWQDCALFRKSVEYDLAAGQPLLLQLSGAARAAVRLGIEPSSVR